MAVIAVAFLVAPFGSWSTSESLNDQSADIKALNLDFHTNVGVVSVFTQKIGNNNLLISVQANGTKGMLADSGNPLNVEFDNSTQGNVLTVTSQVKVQDAFTTGAQVRIIIYVDPDLALNLNISSTTGQVSFNGDNNAVIESLRVETTTGEAQANLNSGVTVKGDITVSAVTGAVNYRMSQTNITANSTLTLHSATGAVNMDITQTKTLQNDLTVKADTSTGSINVGLTIDGGVAAKIVSQTNSFGDISVDKNNFTGSDENLQSLNYPSQSNIEIDNRVHGFGGINIRANYLTSLVAS